MDELGPVLGGGVVQQLVAGHDSVKLSAHVAAGRGRHGQAGGQAGGGEDIAGSVCGSDCCWAGQPEPAVGQLVPSPGRKQLHCADWDSASWQMSQQQHCPCSTTCGGEIIFIFHKAPPSLVSLIWRDEIIEYDLPDHRLLYSHTS